MTTTRNAIAQSIAQLIKDYNKVSIVDQGDHLEISDRNGTTKVPIRTSQTANRSTSTFR